MIRTAVTVSLVEEARGGPFIFWHDLTDACRRAAELGFDAIEIFPPAADAIIEVELRQLLSDHGLKLAAIGTGAGWVKHKLHLASPDAAIRQQAMTFIRAIIDLAARFDAPAIIGSMQGRTSPGFDRSASLALLRHALDDLGEHARLAGVPLLFEPLNRYETNLINTLEAGVLLLTSLGTRNVKLLADLFHMNIEETDIAAALRQFGSSIGHIHFVDSNRRPAGMGHIDYAPISAALRDIQYDGYLSAEALSYPDPDTAARTTIQTFRRFFAAS